MVRMREDGWPRVVALCALNGYKVARPGTNPRLVGNLSVGNFPVGNNVIGIPFGGQGWAHGRGRSSHLPLALSRVASQRGSDCPHGV